jgi:hypothetical protein
MICTSCLGSLLSSFFCCSSIPVDVVVQPSPRRSPLSPSATPVDHMHDLQMHGTLELLTVPLSTILSRLLLHTLLLSLCVGGVKSLCLVLTRERNPSKRSKAVATTPHRVCTSVLACSNPPSSSSWSNKKALICSNISLDQAINFRHLFPSISPPCQLGRLIFQSLARICSNPCRIGLLYLSRRDFSNFNLGCGIPL